MREKFNKFISLLMVLGILSSSLVTTNSLVLAEDVNISSQDLVDVYVKTRVNVRDETGKTIVRKAQVGEQLTGYQKGSYFYFSEAKSLYRVHTNFVTSHLNENIIIRANVNVRDMNNNIIGKAYASNSLSGYVKGNYFYTTFNNRAAKIHINFIIRPGQLKEIFIANNVNIRDSSGKLVAKAHKGESYYGFLSGNYYFISDSKNSLPINKVHKNFVSHEPVKTTIAVKSRVNLRNESNKVVGKAYQNNVFSGYYQGNYFHTNFNNQKVKIHKNFVQASKTQLYRVVRVVDGDTIIVNFKGKDERLRLIGVDTPESVHPDKSKNSYLGVKASNFTKNKLTGKHVSLEFDVQARDHYGRLLAYVYLDNVMFNKTLLRSGYAQVATYPPNVKYTKDFLDLEREARNKNVGLWSQGMALNNSGGSSLPPSYSQAGKGKIKGNINSKGEKIYHLPGGAYYNKTKIDTSKGERWFNTEKEARAAGWRKSKR